MFVADLVTIICIVLLLLMIVAFIVISRQMKMRLHMQNDDREDAFFENHKPDEDVALERMVLMRPALD